MNANQVVMIVLAVFFVLGAADRCLGNKIGFGAEFERGFGLMGPIALSILGLTCIAPLVADILKEVVVPVYHLFGADAAMFAGTFFSPDAGGYAVAAELAEDPEMAYFSALVVGSIFGAAITMAIPIACGLIPREDTRCLAVGMLSGFIGVPLGGFVGGWLAGLRTGVIFHNLLPVILIAALVIFGLALFPNQTIKVFQVLAKLLQIMIMFGLVCGAVEKMTGFTLVQGMRPITDGFQTVGSIGLTLGGALPLIWLVTRTLKGPLERVGNKLGINAASIAGFFVALASIVPAYASMKDMNTRGKVMVAAFTATSANILGPHLGFAAATNQGYIIPMMGAKLAAALIGLPVALFFSRRLCEKEGTA
jgi:ethanolamine transporter